MTREQRQESAARRAEQWAEHDAYMAARWAEIDAIAEERRARLKQRRRALIVKTTGSAK
jgi:hypothetical protein